jgi:hypothetical protein
MSGGTESEMKTPHAGGGIHNGAAGVLNLFSVLLKVASNERNSQVSPPAITGPDGKRIRHYRPQLRHRLRHGHPQVEANAGRQSPPGIPTCLPISRRFHYAPACLIQSPITCAMPMLIDAMLPP